MRIFNKYRGTRGFVAAAERGIRWRYMITQTAIRRTETRDQWGGDNRYLTIPPGGIHWSNGNSNLWNKRNALRFMLRNY